MGTTAPSIGSEDLARLRRSQWTAWEVTPAWLVTTSWEVTPAWLVTTAWEVTPAWLVTPKWFVALGSMAHTNWPAS